MPSTFFRVTVYSIVVAVLLLSGAPDTTVALPNPAVSMAVSTIKSFNSMAESVYNVVFRDADIDEDGTFSPPRNPSTPQPAPKANTATPAARIARGGFHKHFAHVLAHHVAANTRRGFKAQQDEGGEEEEEEDNGDASIVLPARIPCNGGEFVAPINPNTTTIRCNNADTTLEQFSAMPPNERRECVVSQSANYCLCPDDFVRGELADDGDGPVGVCMPNPISCVVSLVTPNATTACAATDISTPSVNAPCNTASMNDIVAVRSTMRCNDGVHDFAALGKLGLRVLPDPDETVVMYHPASGTLGTGQALSNTSSALFGYISYNTTAGINSLILSRGHPFSERFADLRCYNFNRLSDERVREKKPVALVDDQEVRGLATWNYNLDLSTVPREFFSGGRLFCEVGLHRIGGAGRSYVDAFFLDVPAEELRLQERPKSSGLSSGAVAGIVVGCLAFAAVVIGGVSYYRHRQDEAAEEHLKLKED